MIGIYIFFPFTKPELAVGAVSEEDTGTLAALGIGGNLFLGNLSLCDSASNVL